jgi:hypothetical protein
MLVAYEIFWHIDSSCLTMEKICMNHSARENKTIDMKDISTIAKEFGKTG